MTNIANQTINKKINKYKIILDSGLIGLLGYLFIGLFLSPAHAQTMSNKDYIIRMEGFTAVSGITQGNDYKVRSNIGGFNASSEGVNFKVKSGLESLTANSPFSISISSDIIDFGSLNPTNPVIRTANIITNSMTAYGYSVLVYENNHLEISPESDTFIPDTTCDFGACGTEIASEWTNVLTYGLGYRCDNVIGFDCDSSFTKANLYKHFPNIASNDDLQSVMAGIGSNSKETRISYKVNVSGSQPQDVYSNTVTYISVPIF